MPHTPETVTRIGFVRWRHRHDVFGIKANDRLRHMLVVGQTGTGKSTLLRTMLMDDLANGAGVCLIDPHGDLVRRIFHELPKHRRNDVVYFDATDTAHPFTFNPLAEVPTHKPTTAPNSRRVAGGRAPGAASASREGSLTGPVGHESRLVSAILSAFKKTWPDFWGPRSEHLLRMALLALVEFPGMTLLDLNRFLSDANWRTRLAVKVSDPLVRSFWTKEFPATPERLQAESLSPLQNKVGALAGNPLLRGIFGRSKSRVRLHDVLFKGKILLVNLSRGSIGLDACVLLGSLLLALLESAVLARADVPESERKPFYLYVDEFALFATPQLTTLLAEGRKYGLGATFALQSLAIWPKEFQAALLANAGSLTAFRLGAHDAILLAPEFSPRFNADDLRSLPALEFVIKLLIDGHQCDPFSGGLDA